MIVDLLEKESLWLTSMVNAEDIEQERQQLEAVYDRKLAVHEITHPTHSGAKLTRVTWKVV